MRKILFIIIGCVLFSVTSTFACRCVNPENKDAYAKANVIVQAIVKDIIISPSGEGGTAVIEVSNCWKTNAPSRMAVVSLTNCAFLWEINKEYILFIFQEKNGIYSSDRCSGNKNIDSSKSLLEWLNKHGKTKAVIKVK